MGGDRDDNQRYCIRFEKYGLIVLLILIEENKAALFSLHELRPSSFGNVIKPLPMSSNSARKITHLGVVAFRSF